MNRNTVFMYIAVSLVMLVPVPGRLYYGIPVIVILNLLMVLILQKAITLHLKVKSKLNGIAEVTILILKLLFLKEYTVK